MAAMTSDVNERPVNQAEANESDEDQGWILMPDGSVASRLPTPTSVKVPAFQSITTMRAAPCLDDLLPGWTNHAFSAGQYHPFNLAMPLRLPARANPEANWRNDGPISEMGKAMATMVGLAASGTSITKIICSPAFKCIQTAHYILKGMGNEKFKICVEPGLADWCAFQTWPLKFFSPAELQAENIQMDENYDAVMTVEDLTKCLHETLSDYNHRGLRVIKEISAKSDATEHILLIAHASTMETIPRRLQQGIRPAENIEETTRRIATAGNHYPPGAMVTIKQTSDNAWQRINIMPPFISSSGDNIVDEDFYYGR